MILDNVTEYSYSEDGSRNEKKLPSMILNGNNVTIPQEEINEECKF